MVTDLLISGLATELQRQESDYDNLRQQLRADSEEVARVVRRIELLKELIRLEQ
ncbi:MAG: hypothetical protein IIC87_04690 [Chloroflexi bacterium]|nr:hypothetical protein [Chloroflexota bacterium]